MFKYLLPFAALIISANCYAIVNYNPSTGTYTVDKYGSMEKVGKPPSNNFKNIKNLTPRNPHPLDEGW